MEFIQSRGGIDAVIIDIQMPEMDGVEQLLDLGVNDFVYKPKAPKIVEIRVRNG